MKPLNTIGVVGAGTMGAALAQKFAQEGFQVVLADREMRFVERGMENIRAMLAEGVQKNVFTTEAVGEILSHITGTASLTDLKACDVVIEAIFEDYQAKRTLFTQLSQIVPDTTILATNTSSFSVSELAAAVTFPERFIGLHYFYHAAKNRLVEIIPGPKTSPDVFRRMEVFCTLSGKDAITCQDSYGFVVNRYFVPWLNEAVRILGEGVANIATIDDVCRQTFGIGMGPFALMNATGIPVAYHAQSTLEIFGYFYHVSDLLKTQAEKKEDWKLEGEIATDEALRKMISERMLGVIFFVCSQLLDEKVCTATAINRGARIGLQWKKGPIDLMKRFGGDEVNRLIRLVAERYRSEMPLSVGNEYWKMDLVTYHTSDSRAIIRIERPEDLNALNEEVVRQLDDVFTLAESNPDIRTIFITGAGKAFVAGADIKFFVENMKRHTLENIEKFTTYGQQVFEKVDRSGKTVVAVLNGLALGGGLELALCADTLLAFPKAAMAFPETGIGIYPALGGTQRCSRRVGKGLAKFMILTGQMLSANDAEDIGLVDRIISPAEMFSMFDGEIPVPAPVQRTLSPKWSALANVYDRNPFMAIVNGDYVNGNVNKDEALKLGKIMSRKAPIAMRIAEDLIEGAKGCDAELAHLRTIFSTSDALLGLTSVGKRVEYEGK